MNPPRRTTQLAMGGRALELNRPETAIRHLDRALKMARRAGDVRVVNDAHQSLGEAMRRLGRRAEACEHFEAAILGYRAAADRASESETLYGLGRVCEEDARPEDALAAYERSLALRDDPAGRMKSILPQAHLLARIGRQDEAGERYRSALEIARATGDRRLEGEALEHLAIHLQNRMELEAALALQHEALAAFRDAGDAELERRVLGHLRRLHFDLGLRRSPGAPQQDEFGELEDLRQELEAAREKSDPAGEAAVLMRLAEIHFEHDQPGGAITRASQARALARDAGAKGAESDYLRFMAHCWRVLGRGDLAQSDYENALALAREVRHRASEFDALWGLAAVAHDGGDLDRALDLFDAAIAIYESSRRTLATPDLRVARFSVHDELYRNAIRVAVEKGDLPRAFHLAERRAARTLLELLAESRSGLRGLDDRLRQERIRLLAETAASELEEMELEERWRIHEREVRRGQPGAAALDDTEIVDAAIVQRELLDGETILLAWVLDEPESLLFVLRREDLHVFRLPSGAEIARMVQELRAAVEEPAEDALPNAFALYQALLAPAEELIAQRRLIVMPDRDLHLLPFSALLTAEPEPGQDASELPWLVRRHAVVSVPSASAARQLRRERLARTGAWDLQFLAFGDPAAPVPPLAFARAEVVSIAALFDSGSVAVFLGGDATKDAVERCFDPAATPRSSRFVHFATHGRADLDKPKFSELVFTPGAGGDARWRTLEIFSARIVADLVVLSACESGVGRVVEGEGLLGLARAFFHAGATSLCASLWSVDDEATSQLMVAFYRHLLGGVGKAEALRLAQIELLEAGGAHAHPYYWAPFALLGEWSATAAAT